MNISFNYLNGYFVLPCFLPYMKIYFIIMGEMAIITVEK